ncbi:MAG: purine-nucleoside phosphorylase [Bacteroidales bacterium]|jgi:purine-nucleoside phosphorylase|nr:purine-nucleoside phosphorylase [Bacteroidales bacterium]MDI9591639.1 purine-nucleoside phosphorylase [Bacteroidota bacterium]OQC38577.1 MAG: Purine nucleoside phosphorylase 1 [Bacteroidetes bacterium ADurb.Bin041]MBP7874878.1 purine-nucleoside phosphorylase [Bacteroidales bacterium]MCO6468140.1 purine-nucleoside phosphorylase [Bacteroidales bacterium]
MYEKIEKTRLFIENMIGIKPEIGIVLGTGLGNFTNKMEIIKSIPYNTIPNFPLSTVQGHRGQLILGKIGGKICIALQGRFHYYEGYSMQEVTFPIRVIARLGIKYLFLSNASGGTNPDYEVGDIMIIEDHINLTGQNPLIGPNDDRLGPRFPDMSEVYDKKLIALAKSIATDYKITVQCGVYAAVTGPNYETPAEYRYIRKIGADAVGMSTVPEAIVARHMNLPCFAISVISDLGVEGKIEKITHEEVIDAASLAEPLMTKLIKKMIQEL